MTARPDPDLFGGRDAFGLPTLAGPVPDEVLAGLAKLAGGPPLWGERLEWTELVEALRSFETRWGGVARHAGWSLIALYGLCPVAPRARVQRTGAAFVACLRGHRVVDVDATAITMVTRTAARLKVYRRDDDQGAVAAWELCRAA